MSGRTILVGALALICGMTAAMGMTQFLSEPVVQQVEPVATTKLPVAAIQIGRGEKINEVMIVEREWPTELVPEGAVLNKEELEFKNVELKTRSYK